MHAEESSEVDVHQAACANVFLDGLAPIVLHIEAGIQLSTTDQINSQTLALCFPLSKVSDSF